MTVQELLLEVFCLIDDEGQAHPLGQLRPRRRDPVLTHSEGITIELVGKLLGFADDSDLFWFFLEYHLDEFPNLARVHRTTFARQAAHLHKLKEIIHLRLAERLRDGDPLWWIDRMPMPVCRFGRGGYWKGFRGQAARAPEGAAAETPGSRPGAVADAGAGAREEGVNGQLAGRFGVNRLLARDLWHLAHRMIRKVLSHTVAIWLTSEPVTRPCISPRSSTPEQARRIR